MRIASATVVSATLLSFLLSFANPLAAQAAWIRVYPTPSPAPRQGAGFAFDSVRGVVVLVGGDTPDAWQWNGTTWSSMLAGPASRTFPAMTFDMARGRVVLFGGMSSTTSNPVGDTWTWDGSAWAQRFPAHSPSLRSIAAMAFDPVRSVAVLFGGNNQGTWLGDLWEWNGSDWQQRTFGTGPSPRGWTALAFDPNTSKVLLFGGQLGGNNSPLSDETWLWDGTAWEQRFPPNTPYLRSGHGMATDAARRRVVLYGSYQGNDPFAWEWDGTTWAQRLLSSPSPRGAAAFAFDGARNEVVLFGGVIAPTGNFDLGDTWLYRTPLLASFTPYGSGCPGGNGIPVLAPQPYSLPWIGDTFSTQVTALPATAGGVFFLLGVASTPPMSLAAFGLPGCSTYVTLDESVFVPVVAGTATRSIAVPTATALAGLHLFQQAGVLDSAAAGGAALTNAGELVVGIR